MYIRKILKEGLVIIKDAWFVSNKYLQLIFFIKKIKVRYESESIIERKNIWGPDALLKISLL